MEARGVGDHDGVAGGGQITLRTSPPFLSRSRRGPLHGPRDPAVTVTVRRSPISCGALECKRQQWATTVMNPLCTTPHLYPIHPLSLPLCILILFPPLQPVHVITSAALSDITDSITDTQEHSRFANTAFMSSTIPVQAGNLPGAPSSLTADASRINASNGTSSPTAALVRKDSTSGPSTSAATTASNSKKRKSSPSRQDRNPSMSHDPHTDDDAASTVSRQPKDQKRTRVHFSCVECHRRKQKCDRKEPCSQCVARRVPHLCRPFLNGVEDPHS